jgi:glycosyltransferase involved in cell wall biosynthesis
MTRVRVVNGESNYHRVIWLSDIHLGTPGCKAGFLHDFQRFNVSDVLYLAGDIIDDWALKRSWCWDQHNNDVIQKLLSKVLEPGLERNDRFLGYLKRGPALSDCYCAGDAFIFASATKTQGLVPLESMTLGVPVISTAVIGTRDRRYDSSQAMTRCS